MSLAAQPAQVAQRETYGKTFFQNSANLRVRRSSSEPPSLIRRTHSAAAFTCLVISADFRFLGGQEEDARAMRCSTSSSDKGGVPPLVCAFPSRSGRLRRQDKHVS